MPSPRDDSRPTVLPIDAPTANVAPDRLVEDTRVERVVLRSATVGAIIGAVICAPLYVGLVFLAVRSSGTAVAPPLAMSIGLGLYAGLFLGGSMGTLVGSRTLEHYEREHLPAAPTPHP